MRDFTSIKYRYSHRIRMYWVYYCSSAEEGPKVRKVKLSKTQTLPYPAFNNASYKHGNPVSPIVETSGERLLVRLKATTLCT